ncbi:MAG: bifunctional precorrin-2 dehydrogenase/sirohydrochlorin ferrochelatase, partial [Chloroflexi bacterium]|nr:bifunctional precorrin-2 dehydrogenase/sirohydrochlorin ferrochelatase [Chloroflexota bacterium]
MKKRELPNYYPVFLKISSKRCVVVGGGQVALRKVRTLLEHGASVEVISPDLCPELSQLAESGTIGVRQRSYQAGDLQDAAIAIAATDSRQTNLEVAQEARRKAVLVNVVDDAESSDFIAPSYLRRGDITIAISTAGRSPALARKIRSKLEKDFGEEYASLALLLDEVRAEVKQQGIKVDGDAWQDALDLDLLCGLLS